MALKYAETGAKLSSQVGVPDMIRTYSVYMYSRKKKCGVISWFSA